MKWRHPLQGRTRKEALADVLSRTVGAPYGVRPENIERTFPAQVIDGGASWIVVSGQSVLLYCEDSMERCLRHGLVVNGRSVTAKG